MATITIDVNDLPARLAEALDLARAGSEVVVQDSAGPVAKLVPMTSPTAKRDWSFNLHPGSMQMGEDFSDYIDEAAFLRGDP